ncbi:MAG TPA: NADP-dependent oxidoreductase [Hyphomonadaceae bacterium]|jgi:NADPH-dependent curcumin reductase CurA|nr:NADP-dependent oxidoreductase [Hyphomonadaceae bacterium]
MTNRQILIAELPKGKLGPEHFRLGETALPSPKDGEVLVKAKYLQIDAAMRAWMMGPTYRAALKAGDVMAGSGLADVVESKAAGFAPGDLVYCETGWQDYAALPASALMKLERIEPLTHLLSVYGVAGLTAYLGLMQVGQPKPGETVAVSAAAGAVGLFAGQIAKLKGCRAVGIAGGKAKCDMLTAEFGFDAAVDYKAGNIYQQLMSASQGGIDVFFDNVGGEVFEGALFNMKPGGRLVACGVVSAYDLDPTKGLQAVRGVPAWFISRRLTLKGFIVTDFYGEGRREAAIAELKGWVDAGKLKVREDIIDGFENLPAALIGLLAGENIGKRIVKV